MPLTEPHPISGTAKRSPLPVHRQWSRKPAVASSTLSFADVLEGRRSVRTTHGPRFRDIIDIVASGVGARAVAPPEAGDRHIAPVISAGALHAVRITVLPLRGDVRIFAYDARQDLVQRLVPALASGLVAFRDRVRDCLPTAGGYAIILLADAQMAGRVYRDPESLLWRDAGAILQTLAMVAWAEGHALCPIGLHGDEVAHALSIEASFQAVGAAVIGRR